jgi:hypothetical protein
VYIQYTYIWKKFPYLFPFDEIVFGNGSNAGRKIKRFHSVFSRQSTFFSQIIYCSLHCTGQKNVFNTPKKWIIMGNVILVKKEGQKYLLRSFHLQVTKFKKYKSKDSKLRLGIVVYLAAKNNYYTDPDFGV